MSSLTKETRTPTSPPPTPPKEDELQTALMHASFGGHTEVVKLLIQAGAKLDLQDAVWCGV